MAILINQELLEYLVLEELPESVAPEVLLDLLEPADMVDIAESRMAIPTSQEHQERPEQGVQLELVVPEMIVVPAERRAIAELAVPGTLDQPQSAPLDTRDRIRTRLGMVPSTTESRMAIPINQELLEHLVLEVQLESLALGVLLESVDMVERLAPAELAVPATLDRPRSALLDTRDRIRIHPGMVLSTKESRMAILINRELLEHLESEVLLDLLESVALEVLLESVDMVEGLDPAESPVPATLDRPRSALLDTLVPTRTHPGMVPNTNPAPAERDTRRRSRPPPPTNRRQLPAPAVRPLRDSKKMDPRAAPAESRAPAERRPPPTNQAHQVKEAKAE